MIVWEILALIYITANARQMQELLSSLAFKNLLKWY